MGVVACLALIQGPFACSLRLNPKIEPLMLVGAPKCPRVVVVGGGGDAYPWHLWFLENRLFILHHCVWQWLLPNLLILTLHLLWPAQVTKYLIGKLPVTKANHVHNINIQCCVIRIIVHILQNVILDELSTYYIPSNNSLFGDEVIMTSIIR